MNSWGELIVGLVILVGLAGIVLPVLPGTLLILGAVLVWALEESSALGWLVLVVSIGIAAAATFVKFLIPGRKLRESGIPVATLMAAAFGAVVGFFAIPVLGGPIGFMLGIYLVEWSRRGRAEAWPATKRTAGAIALSVGIELGGGLLIAGLWLAAAILG